MVTSSVGLTIQLKRFFLKAGLSIEKVDREGAYAFLERIRCREALIDLERVGGSGDGSYEVPAGFVPQVVISPGVGTQTSFEESFLERGIKTYLIDKKVPESLGNFPQAKIIREYLRHNFVLSADGVTLRALLKEFNGDILLQMDIEGDEIPILLSLSEEELGKISVMILELHNIENLLSPKSLKIANLLMDKIKIQHLLVSSQPNLFTQEFALDGFKFHSHVELTFLRRDLEHGYSKDN